MYNIDFYETADGFSDVKEFLDSLRTKAGTVKDARIQFGQVARYIELLEENGTNLPITIAKHLKMRSENSVLVAIEYSFSTSIMEHRFFCIIFKRNLRKHPAEKSSKRNPR